MTTNDEQRTHAAEAEAALLSYVEIRPIFGEGLDHRRVRTIAGQLERALLAKLGGSAMTDDDLMKAAGFKITAEDARGMPFTGWAFNKLPETLRKVADAVTVRHAIANLSQVTMSAPDIDLEKLIGAGPGEVQVAGPTGLRLAVERLCSQSGEDPKSFEKWLCDGGLAKMAMSHFAPQSQATARPTGPSYAEKVIAEHSGCGQGPQADMLRVSMHPGDQIVQRNPRFLFLTGEKAQQSASAAPATVEEMVNRFLGWKLPEHFHPDAGIKFDLKSHDPWGGYPSSWPVGTNLFDAQQARGMVEHMLGGKAPPAASAAKGEPVAEVTSPGLLAYGLLTPPTVAWTAGRTANIGDKLYLEQPANGREVPDDHLQRRALWLIAPGLASLCYTIQMIRRSTGFFVRPSDGGTGEYRRGWSECHAAWLAAAPPPQKGQAS